MCSPITAGMGGEAAPTTSLVRPIQEMGSLPHPEWETFSEYLGLKLTTRPMREHFLSCFSSSLQHEMTDSAISIKVSPTPCLPQAKYELLAQPAPQPGVCLWKRPVCPEGVPPRSAERESAPALTRGAVPEPGRHRAEAPRLRQTQFPWGQRQARGGRIWRGWTGRSPRGQF